MPGYSWIVTAALFGLVQTPSAPATDEAGTAEATRRLAVAAPALAAWPNTTLVGYDVSSRSPRAIREEMNRERPAEQDGSGRFDAMTRWSYSTRWQRTGPDKCEPQTAEVNYVVTVTLPDLSSRDRLSGAVGRGWDAYFARLSEHELNHARIAAKGAERMQAAMRASTTCDEIQAAAQRISGEASAASQEYDRLTQHGRREGAVYP